jgi:DNA-binding FadR family transcriptional regulator
MAKESTGRTGEPPVLKPWPKRPARLAQAVVESLTDTIVSGAIPPGSTLPVEPDLCETFGVSRITVREAVKSLEAKGLVLARQGYGTTVTSPEEWNLLDPVVLAATVQHDDQLVVLDQLVDIRSTLEAQMTAQAAELATDDDLTAIERLLAQLDEETAVPARFIETDVAFHDRIMQASSGSSTPRRARRSCTTALRTRPHASGPTPSTTRSPSDCWPGTPRGPRRPWRHTSRPPGPAAACRTSTHPRPEHSRRLAPGPHRPGGVRMSMPGRMSAACPAASATRDGQFYGRSARWP